MMPDSDDVSADPATVLIGLALFALLLAVAIIDLQRMIIPNWANAALLVLGAANTAFRGIPSALAALIGACIGAAAFLVVKKGFKLLRGQEGLGWGDVKFMAGAGSLIGPLLLPWLVLFASISGLLMVLFFRSGGTSARLPFAPHLALGLMVCWLLQAANMV
jgi:leader peptidase (prepilin peptidase) / N-methyltransferase